jgi:hypothetical protein
MRCSAASTDSRLQAACSMQGRAGRQAGRQALNEGPAPHHQLLQVLCGDTQRKSEVNQEPEPASRLQLNNMISGQTAAMTHAACRRQRRANTPARPLTPIQAPAPTQQEELLPVEHDDHATDEDALQPQRVGHVGPDELVTAHGGRGGDKRLGGVRWRPGSKGGWRYIQGRGGRQGGEAGGRRQPAPAPSGAALARPAARDY